MTGTNSTPNETRNSKTWTPEEREKIEAGEIDDEVFAQRLFEQIESSPSLITNEQLDLIEDRIKKDSSRRAALALATLSGSDLCQKINEDRETAIAIASVKIAAEDARLRYQQLADLLDQLKIRVSIALCGREDMDAILETARAEWEA
jgi:hypothetical protein